MKQTNVLVCSLFITISNLLFASTTEVPTLANDSITEIIQHVHLKDLLNIRVANQNFHTLVLPFLYLRYFDSIKTIDVTYTLPEDPFWYEDVFALKQISNFYLPYAICNEIRNITKNNGYYIYKEYLQKEFLLDKGYIVRTLNTYLLQEKFDSRYQEIITKLAQQKLFIIKSEDINIDTTINDCSTFYYFPTLVFDEESLDTIDIIIEKYGYHIFDKEGNTVAHWASKRRYNHSILPYKNIINIQEASGYTPLIFASNNNKKNMVQLLLMHGADPNRETKYRYTALFWACNNPEIVELLLDYGSNIDHQDRHAVTSLMRFSKKNYIENVKLLLAAGANRDLKDDQGRTALDCAYEYEGYNAKIIALLTDKSSV